ncbi:RNA polymerase sigma factor [Rummeliibacillus sp. G93]|uniref:RNA polymerase sigma factor n=1 Tax=Rummeliibacillus TaxID=648802 RepID=UPI00116AE630|nr:MULTISPECIES: RNA polymerase sigma factor [Rummeliibacillus]MBB5171461.1 RNA polymerase sigma-70 factor (ECF subfamily) [Rummeliibacillus stabekisii]UQW97146.1 RNA polymerase sigma factor [Rummeliibacillus sp. G93]GEL05768.1 RNA polymerase sigma factor SigV [Rummeliibacillus stabekisii]
MKRKKQLFYDDDLVEWIRQNKKQLYWLAYSYVKNEQDALDIVQDSIQKAMQNYQQLLNKEKLKSWFYRIVINTSLDFLKKFRRVQVTDDETLLYLSSSSEDQYENLDLAGALERLPTKYREIVILRYFEDLKIEEVAYILNENSNTIKTRLYKALKILRIDMEQEEG